MSYVYPAVALNMLGRLVPQGRMRTMALVFTLGFLVAKSCARCAAVHKRRAEERSSAQPGDLQQWEGEGGQNEPPVEGGILE